MTQFSQRDDRPLSELACNYFICKNCGVVDRDYGRMKHGYLCVVCLIESNGASLAFPINIHILIDLAQQSYHSNLTVGPPDAAPQANNIGTVILYCSLREALLNTLIIKNLRARNIDEKITLRMLDDNKMASQKFGKLFTSIFGVRWDGAIAEIGLIKSKNYSNVSDLMLESAELRNEFLHAGNAFGIDRDIATRCIDSIGDLVSLFVALHNEYTHPLLHREC